MVRGAEAEPPPAAQSIFINTAAMRLGKHEAAVFLGFGSVPARSQAAAGMLPHQSLAKSQKSSLRPLPHFCQCSNRHGANDTVRGPGMAAISAGGVPERLECIPRCLAAGQLVLGARCANGLV